MSNIFNKKTKKNITQIPLSSASVGRCYMLLNCTLPPKRGLRFAEMGLTCGTTLCVLQKAPPGDPIQISLRGYSLCIRESDAQHFIVSEVTS